MNVVDSHGDMGSYFSIKVTTPEFYVLCGEERVTYGEIAKYDAIPESITVASYASNIPLVLEYGDLEDFYVVEEVDESTKVVKFKEGLSLGNVLLVGTSYQSDSGKLPFKGGWLEEGLDDERVYQNALGRVESSYRKLMGSHGTSTIEEVPNTWTMGLYASASGYINLPNYQDAIEAELKKRGVTLDGLEAGHTYYVKETKAPYGYKLNTALTSIKEGNKYPVKLGDIGYGLRARNHLMTRPRWCILVCKGKHKKHKTQNMRGCAYVQSSFHWHEQF